MVMKIAFGLLEAAAIVTAACLFALFILAPMEKTVITCAVLHGCQ